MNDMPTAKILHVLIEDTEEYVFMEAMRDYMQAIMKSKNPHSPENTIKMEAAHSFLLKVGQQLYTKDEVAP